MLKALLFTVFFLSFNALIWYCSNSKHSCNIYMFFIVKNVNGKRKRMREISRLGRWCTFIHTCTAYIFMYAYTYCIYVHICTYTHTYTKKTFSSGLNSSILFNIHSSLLTFEILVQQKILLQMSWCFIVQGFFQVKVIHFKAPLFNINVL